MRLKSKKYNKYRGFTLVELVVVVIIVGILATIGVISYSKVTVKAKASKAQNAIGLIAQAEKIFQIDNGSYANITWAQSVNPIVGNLITGIDLASIDGDPDFNYRVTNAGSAQARNTAVLGTCAVNTTIRLNLVTGVWTIPACYR